LTITEGGQVLYRPTVNYAYHPCDDALLSIHELVAQGWRIQESKTIMNSETASGGVDALGILLMGHALNAYWYGSILSVDEARRTVPFNTATSLQVAAGVLSGVAWAIENPEEGILEAEQMDHARILELAKPYLGLLMGAQTDWTPLNTGSNLLYKYQNKACPWQFVNFTSL
jgi:homospermidine synthase